MSQAAAEPSANAELPDPFVEQLLATLLRHRHGHGPSGEAFVASVFGEWGVGKTYCLQQLHRRLDATLAQALSALAAQDMLSSKDELIIPIAFDAWRYERDEHLVVPLVKTLEQRLLALAAEVEARRNAATDAFILANEQLAQTLTNAGLALNLVARSLISTVSAKVDLGVAELKLDGAQLLKLGDQLRGTAPPSAPKSLLSRLLGQRVAPSANADAKTLLAHSSLTLGATERLAEFTRAGSRPRLLLVVLVDDLDRCLPEKAIQVLESIKLFLNVPGYSFVLAVDDEVVERGIAYRYRDYKGAGEHDLPLSGAQYLEKIVHLPLTVPRWTATRARLFLQQRYPDLYGRSPVEGSEREPDSPSQRSALERVIAAVPLVPRKLIRLSEALQFERQRFERSAARAEHWDLLHMLRIVALQQLHPALHRLVREQRSRYWRLFRVRRDPVWELLQFPDPRVSAAAGAHLGLDELKAVGTAQDSNFGSGDEVTLREIRLMLEALDQVTRQRGAGDPVLLFQLKTGEAAPKPADLLGDYAQPSTLFHALYFRGEAVPADAQRVGPGPGEVVADALMPVAQVSDEAAALQALLQPDGDSRREAIERLGLRGRALPSQLFSALVEQAKLQPETTLLQGEWLRDLAGVINDAQLELLFERAELLARWSAPAEPAAEPA